MTHLPPDDLRFRRALQAAKSGDYATARKHLRDNAHPQAASLLAKVNAKDRPTRTVSWRWVSVIALVIAVAVLVALMVLSRDGRLSLHEQRLADACEINGRHTRETCERYAVESLETYRLFHCLSPDDTWFDMLNCAENAGAELP